MPRRKEKPTAAAEPAASEVPEQVYRQTLHIAFDETDLASLDLIAERIRQHPIHGRLHANVGRRKAARFAIAQFARWPVEKWIE